MPTLDKLLLISVINLANIRRLRAWQRRRDCRIQDFLAGDPVPINQIPQLLWHRRQAG